MDNSLGALDKKILLGFIVIVFGTLILASFGFFYVLSSHLTEVIFISSGLAFIIAIISSMFISRTIVKPLRQLNEATKELEKGNLDVRVKIKTDDEIEELGESFNKMVEALVETKRRQNEIDKAKTDLLSITSHELRSPMTPMKAQLQMTLGGYYGKLNIKQKESLNIALRNANRLDKILVDFLDISRIEASRLKFEYKKVEVKSLVEIIIKEMESFSPSKKIKIVSKIKNITVEGDPERISQVFRNILENAKKFSPEKSMITIDSILKDNFIEFIIQDEGIGIKKSIQDKIFEPFFQGEQTIYRDHNGVGLGLAISKGIVESQGGKIRYESSEGKGTTFFFSFPINPPKTQKNFFKEKV